MIRTCESCGKKYRIDTSEVKNKSARFKCKNCGQVIKVYEEEEAQEWLESSGEENGLEKHSAPEDSDLFSGGTDSASAQKAGKGKEKIKIEGISLKSKITLIFVLLVLVSIAIAGFLASYNSRKFLTRQADKYLLQYVNQKSREYNAVFSNIQDQARALADYAEIMYARDNIQRDLGYKLLMPWVESQMTYGTPELEKELKDEIYTVQHVGDILRSAVPNNPYLKLGYIGTETGMTTFDNDEVVEVIHDLQGFDVTERPWYKAAKEQGKLIWTEPYVDANTQELCITCAVPVYNKDENFIGAVGLDVLLNTIKRNILSLNIGYNSYAFLLHNDGKVLVRPETKKGEARWDETYRSENLLKVDNRQFREIVTRMIRGRKGVSSYMAEDEEKYVAFAPLPIIDSSLGIVASRAKVIKPAVDLQNLIIMVCAGVLLLSIIIGLFVGTGITRPINDLTRQANLMSQGKTDLDILEENRKDEIGLLTKSFNRLVMSLKVALSR